MADKQPPAIVEGATTGDLEETQLSSSNAAPKSAEDRKAASALASLDDSAPSQANTQEVDKEAASKAMRSLGSGSAAGGAAGAGAGQTAAKKNVKVDQADVTLLVDQLEINKIKATELLKSHDGDAVKAMKAFIAVKV